MFGHLLSLIHSVVILLNLIKSTGTGYLVQVRQYFPSSDVLMRLAEFPNATDLYLLGYHLSFVHIVVILLNIIKSTGPCNGSCTGYLVQARQYFPSSDILIWLAEFANSTDLYLLSYHLSFIHILSILVNLIKSTDLCNGRY
jgi:hypothetical protein